MTEFLCREITADVIGTYLGVYRSTSAYRSEHTPLRLARELIAALTKRGRETVEIVQKRRRLDPYQNRISEHSAFLVNGDVLVLVFKVGRLNDREREVLEKLIESTTCVVGLALNFGSRKPDFWRSQKIPAQQSTKRQKGIQP